MAELALRMVVSLAVIAGVALAGSRLARNRLALGGARADIDVHARRQLTKTSSVAVIQAGERCFLIAMNDHSITLLGEGDDLLPELDIRATTQDPVVEADGAATTGARRRHGRTAGLAGSGTSVMEALRERTVRRG